MGPGGHRQWPTGINALLERLSLLLRASRSEAINHLQIALKNLPDWKPRYRVKGTKTVKIAHSPPFKFLDIRTRMGEYEAEGLTRRRLKLPLITQGPTLVFQSVPKTFYQAAHMRLNKAPSGDALWYDESAWTSHSSTHDFPVHEPLGLIFGLPLIPTCPRKMFEQGPRHKYVDIVTDMLHASSSDLITGTHLP